MEIVQIDLRGTTSGIILLKYDTTMTWQEGLTQPFVGCPPDIVDLLKLYTE